MQKIPTMFERDETQRGHPVKPVIKPECQWVADGEGVATRKLDGMNVKIVDGHLFKRQKPKDGDYDSASYVPCIPDHPTDQHLWEAFNNHPCLPEDGTYEAIGPKIQGNPEEVPRHHLVAVVPPDLSLCLRDVPRDFDGLREYLATRDIEGVVFHHPDGRMAKIKGRDFGLQRRKKERRGATVGA